MAVKCFLPVTVDMIYPLESKRPTGIAECLLEWCARRLFAVRTAGNHRTPYDSNSSMALRLDGIIIIIYIYIYIYKYTCHHAFFISPSVMF